MSVMSTLTERVAEEIRSAMARRRFTGAQLAKALGVSAAWVSYRVNGTVSPSVDDLYRIAGALEVEVVDLLPREVANTARTLGYLPNHGPMSHGHDRPPNRATGRAGGPGRTSRTRPVAA